MIRILLTYILPILMPTILYLLWLRLEARRAGANGPARTDVPWVWLLGAGVLLTTVLLAGITLMGEGGTERVWVPAGTDTQGHVVPGHFE